MLSLLGSAYLQQHGPHYRINHYVEDGGGHLMILIIHVTFQLVILQCIQVIRFIVQFFKIIIVKRVVGALFLFKKLMFAINKPS